MSVPDYEMADSLELTTAAQHRAVGNLVRAQVLGLLGDRAATISQLATELGALKGSISYHVRLLEEAGLIRVIRTRQVRGVVERYYGRTARRYELNDPHADISSTLLRTAAAELDRRPPGGTEDDIVSLAHGRLDPTRAADFGRRLGDLIEEFRLDRGSAGPMYALSVALFQTNIGPRPDGAGE
jgi:DNA-binding transcriptional ArsR family regulator